MESIIDKRFGRLTVIFKTNEKYPDGSFLYECKCDCGNIVKATSSRLKSGHLKSCGCEQHLSEDLTGRTFNHLKVTGNSHSSGHKAFWNCLCDCDKTTVVRSDFLKNGNTVSCGCIAQQTLNVGRTKLKKSFVDGTSVSQISPDRKLNSNNKTGVKGVYWSSQKQKYRAQITFKGKLYHLGFYDKLEDAARARKQAEENMFGSSILKRRGINEAMKTNEEYRKENRALIRDIKELDSENNRMEKELTKLKKQLMEAESAIKSLKDELLNAQTELTLSRMDKKI